MSERSQVLMLQIVGFLAVCGVVVLCAVLGAKGYPIPAALIASLVSGLIGTLFGQPLAKVTLAAVSNMPPPMAAEVAKRAIASLPPDARTQLAHANVVLTGLTDPPPPTEGS